MTTRLRAPDRRPSDETFAAFARRWPGYASALLDDDRAHDGTRLDRHGDVYLDYTGAGLYPESLVRAHADRLCARPLGNPHSTNPTSRAATELVEDARRAVLEHFRADPAAYAVVFTANASGALKLVGESFPFAPGGRYLLTYDNHNSVNGIREFARARGAEVTYVPVRPPAMAIDDDALRRALDVPAPAEAARLFAYPAQSNFSGVRHPLAWVAHARERGWTVLLDAAAYVPTATLDLSEVRPDFVTLSFYKMFGYPTGVGALVARREALARLRRPWFAGGTIAYAAVTQPRHDLHEGAEAFEDGTLDFLAMPGIADGLAWLGARLPAIQARTRALAEWTLERLLELRHANATPMVLVYGPTGGDGRGASIAFNLQDARGGLVDHRAVEARANDARLSLRTGCFCNPGAGEAAMGISADELATCFAGHDRMSLDAFRGCLADKGTGAVRVSFGWASTFGDAHALIELLRGFAET